jgi:hypothetical protein
MKIFNIPSKLIRLVKLTRQVTQNCVTIQSELSE